jgi:hypothetical protein
MRTAPPVDDFRLVDFVAPVVVRREAWSGAGRAVDVDQAAAVATNQMVMVVANAILESRGRSGGLNAPNEAFADEDAKGVVHGLERDGPDLGAHDFGNRIGGNVGLTRHRAQDGQSLGGDLNAALTKEFSRGAGHEVRRLYQIFE